MLADGTPVLLRPITLRDKPIVRRGIETLSRESRTNRFWTPLGTLSDDLLDRLTDTDPVNHVAWAALNPEPEDPGNPGLGAASYWRDDEDPTKAEFSFTVADEHQGQGIGTLLLGVLWVIAQANGIEEFVGVARTSNTPVIHWLESVGAIHRLHPGQVEFRMRIKDDEALKQAPGSSYAATELARWLDELPGLLFGEG